MNALNVLHWKVKYHLRDGRHADSTAASSISANIEILHEYESAQVFIYDDPCYLFWKDGQIEQLTAVLVHEICHILSEPLFQALLSEAAPGCFSYVKNINERLTTQIERLVLKLIPKDILTP